MFPVSFTALFDACVLYPAPLRDFLLELASQDIFRAKWSEQIHEEWTRNLLNDRPELNQAKIQRTRKLMDLAVPDSLVEVKVLPKALFRKGRSRSRLKVFLKSTGSLFGLKARIPYNHPRLERTGVIATTVVVVEQALFEI